MCGHMMEGSERWEGAAYWSWGLRCGPSWGLLVFLIELSLRHRPKGLMCSPSNQYYPLWVTYVLGFWLYGSAALEICTMVQRFDIWRNRIRFGSPHSLVLWPASPSVSSSSSESWYEDPLSKVSKDKQSRIPDKHRLPSWCADGLQP